MLLEGYADDVQVCDVLLDVFIPTLRGRGRGTTRTQVQQQLSTTEVTTEQGVEHWKVSEEEKQPDV